MSPLSRRSFLAGLAAAPVLSACGGGDDDAAVTTTTDAPTTTSTASTTTVPPLVAPLTGLPFAGDPAFLQRPALIIKINNIDSSGREQARPQAGLNQADAVFEERTEGGITRFAAVFHSSDADPVYPVRSARLTDIDITSMFNRPLFANSGGNAGVMQSVREANLVPVGHADVGSGIYSRLPDRPAPHNLATSTPLLYGLAPEGMEPPFPLFRYREAGAPPVGGTPASGVVIAYGGGPASVSVEHTWVPAENGWARTQRGTPHIDADGVRITPANVAVQFIPYENNRGNLGGSGEGWVFTGGQVIQGTWERPDLTRPTIWKDAAGEEILFAPGRTWMLLPPSGGATIV